MVDQTKERKGIGTWWVRLTAPQEAWNYEAAPTRHLRERLRRAGLTSFIAVVVFFTPLLLIQQASGSPATLLGMAVLMIIAIISLFFNRFGYQTIAALLLVFTMDIVIEGSLLTAGTLSTGWLLTFDLFVIPLVTVGVLLSRQYMWMFLFLHIACILGDFYFMPHAADLQTLIQVWGGPAIAFARPLIIQIGAAVLGFISVRSTDQANMRAEKAELVARLQQQLQMNTQELEYGIEQLTQMMSQAANSKVSSQVLLPESNKLWPISKQLQILFARLENTRRYEGMVYHAQRELPLIITAIRAARSGLTPMYPQPSGSGILDPLLIALREGGSQSSLVHQLSPSSEKRSGQSSNPQTLHGTENWAPRTLHGTENWTPPGKL